MKNLGFLIMGFAAGVLVTVLASKVSEECRQVNREDLRDQISDRLESLEKSYMPA